MRCRILALWCALCIGLPCVAAAQLPRYWWSRGAGGGGGIFSPSFQPQNSNVLYATTDMGTVFRSRNNGALWDSYPFGALLGGRLAKVLFTANPNVLYTLDGRVDYATYNGANVFRSMDGGINWALVGTDPTSGDPTRKKLRADPNAVGRLILGHDSGLWFSSNGGTNWTQFYAPGSGCYLAEVFFCGSNIFAAGNFGLYASTNNGATFAASSLTGIGAGEAIVSFAGAAQGGRIRLYCVTLDSATAAGVDDGYPSPPEAVYNDYTVYKGVYARDWPAGSWTKITTGISATDYPAIVGTATGRTDVVYLAGVNDPVNKGWPAIYRSANAGTNWTSVFDGGTTQNALTGWDGNKGDKDWSFGGGPLGFEVCPSDPSRVLFSDLGYLHSTTNSGTFWQALYVPPAELNPAGASTPKHRSYHSIGLEVTSCWWLSWLDSNAVFASFTDIGALRSTNAGCAWITTETSGLLYSTNILAATPVFLPATNYPFYHPVRVFTNPYDTNEVWATSFGNGLRVGWLNEPRPQLAPLAITNHVVTIRGSARDSQRVYLQASTNLVAWTDLATNLVTNSVFTGTDAAALPARCYRTTLASPVIGQD